MTTPGVETKLPVARLIEFLETGNSAEGLFASDLFLDLSLPQWRVQSDTAEKAMQIRSSGHPCPGQVRVERLSQTDTGFTMEFEERWDNDGQSWYCREMIRADVVDDAIVEMAIYCTGDWDEATQHRHTTTVGLLRP